jgi:hypothetical protein
VGILATDGQVDNQEWTVSRNNCIFTFLSLLQPHERKENELDCLQRLPSERAPKQMLYYQLIGRCDPEGQEEDGFIFDNGMG